MIPLSSFVKRHSSQPYAVTSFVVGHVSKRFPDGAHTGLRGCVSRNKWSTMVFVNVLGIRRRPHSSCSDRTGLLRTLNVL